MEYSVSSIPSYSAMLKSPAKEKVFLEKLIWCSKVLDKSLTFMAFFTYEPRCYFISNFTHYKYLCSEE